MLWRSRRRSCSSGKMMAVSGISRNKSGRGGPLRAHPFRRVFLIGTLLGDPAMVPGLLRLERRGAQPGKHGELCRPGEVRDVPDFGQVQ